MTSIEEAILRTVIYADIFNFPLTQTELHHYLIASDPVSLEQIEQTLASSLLLRRELVLHAEYVICAGWHELIALRGERDQASRMLWPLAVDYGQWLARLPFVRMVCPCVGEHQRMPSLRRSGCR